LISLVSASLLEAKGDAEKCSREIGSLSRQLAEHQDETQGPGPLQVVFDQLIHLSPSSGHVGRLIALGNSMRFYALFGGDANRLRQMRDSAFQEEDRLLKAARGWDREEQTSFVETLGEFNLNFYRTFSLEEAEAFYADLQESSFNLVLQGGKKNFFSHILEQYEKVFAPAFPLPVAETLAPLQTKRLMPLLHYDLESIDLDTSLRARWFLSFAYGHLSYRARWREHINRDTVTDFLTDQMKRERGAHAPHSEAKFGDPLRNANPIGSIRGKPAQYLSAHEQELEQVRLLAEIIEQLQLKPKDRQQVETWIEDALGTFTASQLFIILPASVTAQGLTLYQLAQMSPHKKIKDLVNRAIAHSPLRRN